MDISFINFGNKACVIGEDGLDKEIYFPAINYHIAEKEKTVKVEGLESYFKDWPSCTVHCFISPSGAPSFPEHKDPYDVRIKCISGIKTMEVEGKRIEIKEGNDILIPANTPHKATNEYDSIMLSIGYENATR